MWWQTKFHLALVLIICSAPNATLVLAHEPEPDYLNTVLTQNKGQVFRFKSMPVPVFISGGNQSEVYASLHAFSVWKAGTDNLIQFENVAEKRKARVIIKFARLPLPTEDISGTSVADGGHTMMTWRPRAKLLKVIGRSKMRVPPQVVEINLNSLYARPASARDLALQNIIAHELGHAIGILVHSPNAGDLMYTQTDENSKLSARDINTVRKLYQLKPDICL